MSEQAPRSFTLMVVIFDIRKMFSMCSIQQMIIEVQHCVDCHLHNWCSRHNEAKYHDFFHKLEAKAKTLLPHPRIIKNAPPAHYQPRNMAATTGLQVHHYFDEETQEEVVFPRHGAFEVKVNGILIFSKLQSNLWPNLEKIGGLLAQVRMEVEAGRDISKFSLEYRQESNREELTQTYKKLIIFKINKRPQSSQFNASAYLPKGSVQHSPEIKKQQFKRKNVTSLKKGGMDLHRKSEVSRKPLIRFRNSKVEAGNLYCEFPEPKNEDHLQLPQVTKAVKNENCSPHSKKKIQFKDDTLQPIRAQPFQIITNNTSAMKLEKKPSRKLILKLNEKKSENSPHVTHKFSANFEDLSEPSDQVITSGGSPSFFPEIPTKKSFKSMKSVMSIGEKLEGRVHNQIKIEDYTEKQIQKTDERNERKGLHIQKTSVFQSISHTQKLVKQQEKLKEESLQVRTKEKSIKLRPKEEQFQAIIKEQPLPGKIEQEKQEKVEQEPQQETIHALAETAQQPKVLQPIYPQIVHNQPKQQEHPIFKEESSKLVQDYEEQAYDQFEQPAQEQARPQTSSSRRMYREEQAIREQGILEYQQAIEANFMKKGNLTAAKVNQQQGEEREEGQQEEYAERAQDIPVKEQNPPQEQSHQEKNEEESSPIHEQPEEILAVIPNKELNTVPTSEYVSLPQDAALPENVPQVAQVECSAPVAGEVAGDCRLDEAQSLVPSAEGEEMLGVEKAEVQASISRMEETILNSIIDNQPTVSGSLFNQQQPIAAVGTGQNSSKDVPMEASCQFQGQQMEQPAKQEQNRQQAYKQQQVECKPQTVIIPEEHTPHIVQKEDTPMTLAQQPDQKEPLIQNAEQKQPGPVAEILTIPEPNLIAQQEQPFEEPSPAFVENELEEGLQQTPAANIELQPDTELSPQDQPLKVEEPIIKDTPQQTPLEPIIQQDQKDTIKQEQNEPISIQTAKAQEIWPTPTQIARAQDIQPISTEENAPQPICSLRSSLPEQPHPQRQANLPSIHQLSNKQLSRDPQTLRSIPNATQSSIGLCSQIHSELNNVYELIQARLDNRASLDQEGQLEGEQSPL